MEERSYIYELRLRLAVPLEGKVSREEVLQALKGFVQEERGRIEKKHREGAGGREVVLSLTNLVDVVIQDLFRQADSSWKTLKKGSEGCALVALGGYGRRELNPASDVDIMLLYPKREDVYLPAIADYVFHMLWDIGFVLGNAYRSINDCLEIADSDPTSLTSMLEARFLAGRKAVFDRFRRSLRRHVTPKKASALIERKLEEQEARHRRYGSSIYLQEPNVKESPGGLRDLHTALWIARARAGISGLEGLAKEGLLTPGELERCLRALDFLLRIRSELHFISEGKHDVLSFSLQERAAANLGFFDTEQIFGVERFLQRYYLCAKEIHLLSKSVIERCLKERSLVEEAMRRLKAREIGDDFTVIDRQIHIPPRHRGLFQEDPVRLIKVFWYAQQMGYELSQETQDLIRANLHLIGDGFRRSNRALGFFLAILREPVGAAKMVRMMHELGVLSAYIPEFAPLVCLVQFDVYHKYTVDEHTFIALENLEVLYRIEDPFTQELRAIAKELKKPEILKLAILFHDIGKGEGRGHVEKGVRLTKQVLDRMGFPEQDVEEITFLVAEHLTMSHIAQYRDLDDEPMIVEFAKKVGNVDRLKLLYLLTYLDMKAVGPQVWNEWKGALLWELYLKTHTVLTRGVEAEADLVRAAKVRSELLSELCDGFPYELLEEHLDQVPIRYLLTTPRAKVAAHLALVEQVLRGEEAAAQWTHYPLVGYTEFIVCAFGRLGRFAQIAGTLTANGINILSAQVYARKDGLFIRTFQVNDGRGSAVLEEETWQNVMRDLLAVLRGEVDVRGLIKSKRREILAKPLRKGPPPPTRVEFDNVVSESYTVIDVRTQDRLGLLYLISSTLSKLQIDLRLAKITTEDDRVVDVFYVTEKDGGKILDEGRMEEVKLALERAIAEGLL